MRRRDVATTTRWLVLCGAAIGLILCADSACRGSLGKPTLQGKPLELLGGRVLVTMPAGAKVEPRKAASIMGADPSAEEEGRIVLDEGSERFVLTAQETFQWADANFREVIEKRYANCSITPIQKGKEAPRGYLMVPKEAPPDQAATTVASSCMILPDKTVVLLQAYVNREARQDLAGCTALAKEILSRAVGENVPLRREAGARRLRAIVQGKDLQVDLPADYAVSFRRGPDFWVYYIRPLSPYGAVPPTVVLYQGGHPSAFHKQSDSGGTKPSDVASTDGTFLRQKASWARWTSAGGKAPRTQAEAIVSCGDFSKFHVYFSAEKPEDLAACEKIAQSMTLVDKQPADTAKPATGAQGAAPAK